MQFHVQGINGAAYARNRVREQKGKCVHAHMWRAARARTSVTNPPTHNAHRRVRSIFTGNKYKQDDPEPPLSLRAITRKTGASRGPSRAITSRSRGTRGGLRLRTERFTLPPLPSRYSLFSLFLELSICDATVPRYSTSLVRARGSRCTSKIETNAREAT